MSHSKFRGRLRMAAGGVAVLGSLAMVPARSTGPAADCIVNYSYALSASQQSAQTIQATRGQTVSVNRSDMIFVTNGGARPIQAQVTIPTGGNKWVRLEKGQRDPAIGIYLGNVTLQNVKCEYLYESPVAMFMQLRTDPKLGDYGAAVRVKDEYSLGATPLLQALHAYFAQPRVSAQLLHRQFGQGGQQIAATLKNLSFSAGTGMNALRFALADPASAVATPEECGTVFGWMKSGGYALAAIGNAYTTMTVAAGGGEGIVSCMEKGGFSAQQAAATLRQLPGGSAHAPAVLIGRLWPEAYTLAQATQGVAAALGATPNQAADWLEAMPETYGEPSTHSEASALRTAFQANAASVLGWMRSAGHPLNDVVAAVKQLFGLDAAGLAGVLVQSSLTPAQVAAIVKQSFNLADGPLVAALRSAGLSATVVAQTIQMLYANGLGGQSGPLESYELVLALRQGGYPIREVIDGARAVYPNDGGLQISDMLRLANAPATESGAGLRDSFGAGPSDITAWMTHWGPPYQVAIALEAAFKISRGEVVALLKGIGKTAQQSTWILKNGLNETPERASRWLHDGTYGANDAATALKIYYATGPTSERAQQTALWMAAAGWSVRDVADAIVAAFQVDRADVVKWLTTR